MSAQTAHQQRVRKPRLSETQQRELAYLNKRGYFRELCPSRTRKALLKNGYMIQTAGYLNFAITDAGRAALFAAEGAK